jgi:hypothetical protein
MGEALFSPFAGKCQKRLAIPFVDYPMIIRGPMEKHTPAVTSTPEFLFPLTGAIWGFPKDPVTRLKAVAPQSVALGSSLSSPPFISCGRPSEPIRLAQVNFFTHSSSSRTCPLVRSRASKSRCDRLAAGVCTVYVGREHVSARVAELRSRPLNRRIGLGWGGRSQLR